jgi:S-adenosylmethionine decarboxylase
LTIDVRGGPHAVTRQQQPTTLITGCPGMRLFVMDAWLPEPDALVDCKRLRDVLYEGARAGDVTVLGERFHVFPNGAVTGVLLLAQSHLSIHTWPELLLANLDLLTYGHVDGERVLALIADRLDAERSVVQTVTRGMD